MIQKRKNNRDSNGDKATAQAEAGNRGRPPLPEETLSLTGGRQKQEPGRTAEDVGTRSDTANSKPWSRRPRGQPPAGPMEATPCLDRPLEGEINHRPRCQIIAQRVGKTARRAAEGRAVLGHQAARSSALLGSFPFGRLMSPVETKQRRAVWGAGFSRSFSRSRLLQNRRATHGHGARIHRQKLRGSLPVSKWL